MQPPKVTCVVLNYNGWPDTLACVQSLLKQDYPTLSILVVDNHSTDDSVDRIRTAFPQVEVLVSDANNGFSAGNNLGIRHALARGADFLWLLNNDTVAPPDTCTQLVAEAVHPNIGIVGTVLYYQHEPARIQAWGGGILRPSFGFSKHYTAAAKLGPRSFLTFASVLLRHEMLEQIGLLDEGYFMYFEDADLCFRARAHGWQLAVAPGTAVLHSEGGSAGGSAAGRAASVDKTSRANGNRTTRIVTASGMRFLRLHGSPRAVAPLLYLASRFAKRALRGDLRGLHAVLLGMRDWMRDSPTAFQKNHDRLRD